MFNIGKDSKGFMETVVGVVVEKPSKFGASTGVTSPLF